MKPDDSEFSLPQQQVSIDVLLEKYAKGDEQTADDVRRRVARALAAVEQDPARWEQEFFDALTGGFIPGGRVNSAAGTDLQATLINCFVQPVGDSVSQAVDGRPGIYVALMEAAETMRRGGGVGYDFSSIRPKGAFVRGTHSSASGPVSYMRVFDRSCETVESAGSRRGAQMGILRCDHPDIEDFIHAKDHGDLSNFNVSIAVTDAFMRAVETDGDWDLVHKTPPGATRHRQPRASAATARGCTARSKARDLWRQIMQSTYDHAEPGVVFIDRMNDDDNLSYCERLDATNPCGEQPLPAYGCCCLGSINLTLFVHRRVRAPGALRFRGVRARHTSGRAHARQRARRNGVAAAAAAAGSESQAPRRPRLHRAWRHAHHARPQIRYRRGAPHGRRNRRVHARRIVRGVDCHREGERRVSAV